jgi:hypothetical protein
LLSKKPVSFIHVLIELTIRASGKLVTLIRRKFGSQEVVSFCGDLFASFSKVSD